MNIPEIVFYVLVLIVIPAMVGLILKNTIPKSQYEFDIVFMKPGVNTHATVRGDSLEFKHKEGEDEYEIKSERLHRVKAKGILKLMMTLRRVKTRFIVVFQNEKTEPIKPEKVKVSSRILREVHESRALVKALRSEFSAPFDLKKILLIVGALVIGVIVYFLVMGDVVI